MNIETRLSQGLEVSQQLNLAPQLLQWLRLLQLPTNELCTMVQQELETNPTLELEIGAPEGGDSEFPSSEDRPEIDLSDPKLTSFDDQDLGEKFDVLSDMDTDWQHDSESLPTHYTAASVDNEKRQFMMDCITSEESLQDHLLAQLNALRLNERDHALAELIAGSIDQNGYLSGSLDELAGQEMIPVEDLERILSLIQSFDPPGIGARDLKECLLLQSKDPDALPVKLIRDYLEALGRGQYREIAAALKVTEDEVMQALQQIRQLNPNPGDRYSRERIHYVTPDVIIRKVDNDYITDMNDEHIPRLRISASCRRMMESGSLSSEDMAYIRKKIRRSSFLIQGIKQRQETLHKVTREILRHQLAYFDDPNGTLKPLTMAQVAKIIGVHETTVSRALANKYIQTPKGLFEMKYFFRSGYQCEDGSSLIPQVVKDMINQLITQESPSQPLTDLQIVSHMKQKGVRLARRTVAKYREEMGLASSKDRQRVNAKQPVRVTPLSSVQTNTEIDNNQALSRIYA